jgi:hypothetical protein
MNVDISLIERCLIKIVAVAPATRDVLVAIEFLN